MKTLIFNKYYHVTDDMELVYENGDLIPVCLDLKDNWGVIIDDEFVPLHTFQQSGTIWYFTNDFQEIEIREFIRDVLPGLKIVVDQVEWFKTIPSGVHEVSYHVYFKLKGSDKYYSQYLTAEAELDLLLGLIFYGYKQPAEVCYGNTHIKTDGRTVYLGRDLPGCRLFTHAAESSPGDILDALEMRESFVPDTAIEAYYYLGWIFYRTQRSKRYCLEVFEYSMQ